MDVEKSSLPNAPSSTRDHEHQISLSDQLRTASRQKHHSLNTQIIARLPLCLPPHADSPLNYTAGMVVFGQLYFEIEAFLSKSLADTALDPRIRTILAKLHFPHLYRTTRLRQDIRILAKTLPPQESRELDSLAEAAEGVVKQISSWWDANPHRILAHTWTMYLALFNGGRWIRRQLSMAGPAFWRTDEWPLMFWDFVDNDRTGTGGEQLKADFKAGFAEAGSHLTVDECNDVIEETRKLFDLCLEMVKLLDQWTASQRSMLDTLRLWYTSACGMLRSSSSEAGETKIEVAT
jgi:heme oxygenase